MSSVKALPSESPKGRFAVVIPVYNHERAVRGVVERALQLNLPVFVVDDGSTDASRAEIEALAGVCLLEHDTNRGKGAAILTGFAAAAKTADWAITIDADGQHDPEDACGLMHAIPAGSRPIVVGMRTGMTSEQAPWTSRFGRGFSNFWVFLAGGPAIHDSQSGFRIYPLPEAMNLGVVARRYQFEVEILVRANRRHVPVIETPIRVHYSEKERISHFRPFIDFMRNSSTFSRLIFRRIFSAFFG